MTDSVDSVRPNSISIVDCYTELLGLVKASATEHDPAPWFDVPLCRIKAFSFGDESGYVRHRKLASRSRRVLLRGLLSGALLAHYSDHFEARDIPGWAWENAEKNDDVWNLGFLLLDVFLPDYWQRWSRNIVFFDRNAFDRWLNCQDLADGASELCRNLGDDLIRRRFVLAQLLQYRQ